MSVSGGAANPNRALYIGGRDRHDELKAQTGLASALRYAVNGSISIPGFVPPAPTVAMPVLTPQRI